MTDERLMTDRAIYPSGFTIAQAVAYYEAIAPVILPHLRNRPVSFKRYVDTVRGDSFWEKDAPSFTPEWVKRFPVPRREGGPPIEYILINDVRTLRWVASVGGLEIHPFLHVAPRIDIATHVVFDLDPGEGAGLRECARVALLLREALLALSLESFAKVSGSKGIQVSVPLNQPPTRGPTHELTETFARVLADELARRHPTLIVSKMTKALRRRKVFIDWSQNADYKTTAAVYSLRTRRDQPYVSMPVAWDELEKPRGLDFTPDDALARVRKRGDLFAPVLKLKQKLPGVGKRSATAPPRPTRSLARGRNDKAVLPKASSQSGRRLFLLTKTEMGNELWMDVRGRFKRWILRPDRDGGGQLIAMPAGEFDIDRAYARGEVPKAWKGRVTIEDSGAYEVIEGSSQRKYFDLWFAGRVLQGRWTLEKIGGEKHRSWRLAPGAVR
jgi:bifunctional non-homologous end joining protein LigD